MTEKKKRCPITGKRVFIGCSMCVGSSDAEADECARYSASIDEKDYDKQNTWKKVRK